MLEHSRWYCGPVSRLVSSILIAHKAHGRLALIPQSPGVLSILWDAAQPLSILSRSVHLLMVLSTHIPFLSVHPIPFKKVPVCFGPCCHFWTQIQWCMIIPRFLTLSGQVTFSSMQAIVNQKSVHIVFLVFDSTYMH